MSRGCCIFNLYIEGSLKRWVAIQGYTYVCTIQAIGGFNFVICPIQEAHTLKSQVVQSLLWS